MRKTINGALRRLGYQITRFPSTHEDRLTLKAALSRIASRDLAVETIIDIGASDGRWSKIAHGFFPTAHCLLIEANPVHLEGLKQYKQTDSRIDYVIAAASDKVGSVYFHADDPFGGGASYTQQDKQYTSVPATTIDAQVREKNLKAPFLIKLDTHGFEVPILNGAEETLKAANLLVIETYNFDLIEGTSLRFHQMCAYLEERGFRPIDMCDPLYRKRDNAFWQVDLFFVPVTRPEFQSNSYAK
jgi:FkbM family methyltransferase